LHELTTSFVLGYHGCDRAIAKVLIAGDNRYETNEWDWLDGMAQIAEEIRRACEFFRVLAGGVAMTVFGYGRDRPPPPTE
jgi:hypothetical protein